MVAALSTSSAVSAIRLDRIPPCDGACIDLEFLERFSGAAEVGVSLRASSPSILLDRWIIKPAGEVDLKHIAPSACIPDRAALTSRLRRAKRGPYDYPKALEMALTSNEYSLILFLGRGRSGSIEARCSLEFAINWDKFGFFARRLAWVRERLTVEEHCASSGEQTRDSLSAADQIQPIVGARGSCEAGLKKGAWEYDLGAGMAETGQYEAGRRVGVWVFKNGPTHTEKTEYADGRKNGPHIGTDSGHKVEEGQYVNGLRSGTWRAWSSSGALLWEEKFRGGVPLGQPAGHKGK